MQQERRTEAMRLDFDRLYGGPPSLLFRAPGRVDLMGSHTDYNDGYVATMTVDRDTWIALRPRDDRRVSIASVNLPGTATFALDAVGHDRKTPWTDYVRGVAAVLQADGHELRGFDGLLHSTVPFGSGLSSSAAIEVATLLAFEAVSGIELDPVERALAGQRVENEFVGVNSGVLDQYTSVLGTAGHALLLDCRALTSEPIAIAPELSIVICDTRAPRELTGSEYDDRRAECEAGVAHLAAAGHDVSALRDVSLELLAAHADGLRREVVDRCRFIIEENQRVLDLAVALPAGDRDALRELYAASFRGAVELFEIGAPSMLAMADAIDGAPGLIARRQAGAGFGGCLVAIVERGAEAAFESHTRKGYAAATGMEAMIFGVEASPGAGPVGLA